MQLKFDEIEQFMQEINTNPELEIAFWDNYQNKYYPEEKHEQYIISCLDKILETDPESATVFKSIKGGLLLFTQYSYNDIDQGICLLKQAATLGNTIALHNLAYSYITILKDSTTGITLYEEATKKGYAKSQFNLGSIYLDGKFGVTQDFAKALHFLTQAYENNHPVAAYELGWMYEHGCGIPVDTTRALELYKQSAEHNHIRSLLSIAAIYHQSKQFKEEVFYLEKVIALDPCNDVALHNLAFNCFEGKGIRQNSLLAAQLNRRSLCYTKDNEQVRLHTRLCEHRNVEVLYYCYVDNHLPEFFALLIKNPGKITQLMQEDAFLTPDKRRTLFFHPDFQNILKEKNACNVLAEWYLYYAKQEPEAAEDHCIIALENLQCAPRFDRDLANRLYYFMALQYQGNGDHAEAMLYCLETRQYAPANHLLAHLIFTYTDIQHFLKLQMACLYLLRDKIEPADCLFNKKILESKIVHLIKYGKGIYNQFYPEAEIAQLLQGKELAAANTLLELKLHIFLRRDESGLFPEQPVFQEKLDNFIRENRSQYSVLIFFERQLRVLAQSKMKIDFFSEETIPLTPVESDLLLHAADSLKQVIMPDRHKWLLFSAVNEMPETVKNNIFTYYQQI